MGSARRIALVCGSGLSDIAERVAGERRSWTPPRELPNPAEHRLQVVEGTFGGCEALAFAGRLHYYQGYSMGEVVSQVEEAARWGAEVLMLTNAAGWLGQDQQPGDLVVITDHINLMGDSPLRGEPVFVDMSAPYDPVLRTEAMKAASARGARVSEGIYAAMSGPSFETPAEAEMLRRLGVDVVGMSTVPEVIAARRSGLRVLAVSVVTNAVGVQTSAVEVLAAARAAAGSLAEVLEDVAGSLAA